MIYHVPRQPTINFDDASRTRLRLRLDGPQLAAFALGFEAARDRLPGVRLLPSNFVEFDRDAYDERLASAVVRNLSGEVVYTQPGDVEGEAPRPKILQATDEDLETLRRDHFLDETIGADEVFVTRRWIVNNAVNRMRMKFTRKALGKFAVDYTAGRSVLLFHDQRQVEGRTFQAEVVRATRERREEASVRADWVAAKMYIPIAPETERTIRNLRFGVYAYDSIGFAGGDVTLLEEEVGDRTVYTLEIDYDEASPRPLEGGETSFVFLGMTRGAGNDKLSGAVQTGDESPGGLESRASDDLSAREEGASTKAPIVALL